MESRKVIQMNLPAGQEEKHRRREQMHGRWGEQGRVDTRIGT